jgi:hypothetical protein
VPMTGAVVLFIHWRVAAERRGGAGDLFFGDLPAALAELGGGLRRDRLATAWRWLYRVVLSLSDFRLARSRSLSLGAGGSRGIWRGVGVA